MASLYYLNWDREEWGEASDLFHDAHIGDAPDGFTATEFDDLYRQVAEDVDVDRPEEAFAQWNRGSGYESDRFLELRYCSRCDGYIDGEGEAVTHAAQNHGYDSFAHGGEMPEYIRGERSLSVGDVVELDGAYYLCRSIGWEEVTVSGGDAER